MPGLTYGTYGPPSPSSPKPQFTTPHFQLTNECSGPLYLTSIAGSVALHNGTTVELPWGEKCMLENNGEGIILLVQNSKSEVLLAGCKVPILQTEVYLFGSGHSAATISGQDVENICDRKCIELQKNDLPNPGLESESDSTCANGNSTKKYTSSSSGDSSGEFDSYTEYCDCDSDDFGQIRECEVSTSGSTKSEESVKELSSELSAANLAPTSLKSPSSAADSAADSTKTPPSPPNTESSKPVPLSKQILPVHPEFNVNSKFKKCYIDVYNSADVVLSIKKGMAVLKFKRDPKLTVCARSGDSAKFYKQFRPCNIPNKSTFSVIRFGCTPRYTSFAAACDINAFTEFKDSKVEPQKNKNSGRTKTMFENSSNTSLNHGTHSTRDSVVYTDGLDLLEFNHNCDFMNVMRTIKSTSNPLEKCYTFVKSKLSSDKFNVEGKQPEFFKYLA